MNGSSNQNNLNEYTAREAEIEQHIEGRGAHSDMQAEWVYEKEVRELLSRNKYKYQDVVMHNKIGFL